MGNQKTSAVGIEDVLPPVIEYASPAPPKLPTQRVVARILLFASFLFIPFDIAFIRPGGAMRMQTAFQRDLADVMMIFPFLLTVVFAVRPLILIARDKRLRDYLFGAVLNLLLPILVIAFLILF